MKLSISLSDEDVAALDAYARDAGLRSRSAAVQRAIRMLRHPGLEQNYAQAFQEWDASGEQEVWDSAVADGLSDAPR